MAFQSSHKTMALTTSTTSGYMKFQAGYAAPNVLITNPGTTTQYWGFASDANQTLALPAFTAAGGTATETFGTPILPGQQVLVDRNFTDATPYFYGISSSGAGQLIITLGAYDEA